MEVQQETGIGDALYLTAPPSSGPEHATLASATAILPTPISATSTPSHSALQVHDAPLTTTPTHGVLLSAPPPIVAPCSTTPAATAVPVEV